MYDFLILGATGQQGTICTRDILESGYSALLCGRDPSKIMDLLKNPKAEFRKVDLRNHDEIVTVIKESGAKVVINCAELVFNVPIMKACLECKVSVTDLGGLQTVTEEQYKLDEAFQQAGIVNVTGCGSTPGVANVMAAYAISKLDSVHRIELGFARDSNIKKFVVPYSIQSIFDEFEEKPVVLRNGEFETIDRMPNTKHLVFEAVGHQTVYPIVHSEVYTFKKYFAAKGIKDVTYYAGFPKHSIDVIGMLIELGFNSQEQIELGGGMKLAPLDFTGAVLKKVMPPKGYEEVENLRVHLRGTKGGASVIKEMNCIVKTTKGREDAGSNVNTGRTIAVISQMLLKGQIDAKGVVAPEACVRFHEFFAELDRRNMEIFEDGEKICGGGVCRI